MDKFLGNGTYSLLRKAIEEGSNVSVFGLNIGEKLALVEDSAFLFYIVESIDQIDDVREKLEGLNRSCEVLVDGLSPICSEFVNPDKYLSVLTRVINNEINTLILTPEAMLGLYPNVNNLASIHLKIHDEINITELLSKLNRMNYKRVDLVSEPKEYAIRGDIIDIYPVGYQPVRIFVDYDNIDSIKLYNPVTMLTTSDIDSVNIETSNFLFVNNADIERVYEANKIKADNIKIDLCELRSNDYRLMLFGLDKYSNIFEFVDNATIVFDGAKVIYDKLRNSIDEYNKSLLDFDGSLKVIASKNKLELKNILDKCKNHTLIAYHLIVEQNRLFSPQKVFNVRTLPSVKYNNYLDAFVLDIRNYVKQDYTIILCVGNEENINKYSNVLDKCFLTYHIANRMSMCLKNSINILTKSYPLDIILPEEKLAIISTTSLFGKKKKVIDSNINFFDGEVPQSGDYVVHNFHGVGKCLGVETLKINNSPRDYVLIEYKNQDKLYLPVENIDQISKYLGSDKEPTLNKIGGVEFAKTKAKVKSAVKKIAFDLIALYRDRMNLKGIVYPKDDELQEKFENEFGFTETIDQLKAINECKQDMESGKVMDRLVCGDVGFGKTEVALRIAFKTIMSGKQVAILCPTTILSEQHFNTAKSRMSDYGVKVEVLNRLKSSEQVSKIKSDISSGKIDLICGTHKLLSSDIDYKNLGLLILDEEQKFGVADKEKIKNLKKSINVLTLSATPIPRTLNMSLIGVRDISVIETPPVTRISTNVQVVEYNDEIIKSSIDRELSRNGQVLIIYNRVESIYQFASFVRSMIPNAIISVAHGQMTDVELEQEIYKLYSGQTQILISTTLIENGVDLPNANTLIVINSDKLGLSQLYQLKGRIGRSNKDSYAYFTFDSKKMLSENAYKRLQAIQEFSEMGSGFKIAMRDLEIRGAGNLLGAEQSGHIEKIGYNLYVQILGDSIKELSNESIQRRSDVRIETNLPAYLSHNYVTSSAGRMKIYRDIAGIDSMEKFIEISHNLNDVYGDIPDELINLMKIAYVKNLASLIGANKVIIRDKAMIYLETKENITKEIVDLSLTNYAEYISFNFASVPIIEIKCINSSDLLDFLVSYLQLISTN